VLALERFSDPDDRSRPKSDRPRPVGAHVAHEPALQAERLARQRPLLDFHARRRQPNHVFVAAVRVLVVEPDRLALRRHARPFARAPP